MLILMFVEQISITLKNSIRSWGVISPWMETDIPVVFLRIQKQEAAI